MLIYLCKTNRKALDLLSKTKHLNSRSFEPQSSDEANFEIPEEKKSASSDWSAKKKGRLRNGKIETDSQITNEQKIIQTDGQKVQNIGSWCNYQTKKIWHTDKKH